MKPKSFIKNLFVILLFAIFSYQSWLTLAKYLERKTWYQVTSTDNETILFPSITFCKKFMYRQRDFIRNGFIKRSYSEKRELTHVWNFLKPSL